MTDLFYDPIRKEVLELNRAPLLTLKTGRNSQGGWLILSKEYMQHCENLNNVTCEVFLRFNCHAIGISLDQLSPWIR